MKSNAAKILVVVAVVLLGVGIYLEKTPSITQIQSVQISSSEVSLNVPAVDNDGKGVVTTLKVDAKPGNGKVLVDVNQLLFWTDTQYSIQTAKNVAHQITGVDLSKVDLTYSIETTAPVIEGPSAGAALTIATIAALENKPLNKSVMITGTINADGTIGDVGAVSAKANAAKDAGAM